MMKCDNKGCINKNVLLTAMLELQEEDRDGFFYNQRLLKKLGLGKDVN
jgi:hypothetical protein